MGINMEYVVCASVRNDTTCLNMSSRDQRQRSNITLSVPLYAGGSVLSKPRLLAGGSYGPYRYMCVFTVYKMEDERK